MCGAWNFHVFFCTTSVTFVALLLVNYTDVQHLQTFTSSVYFYVQPVQSLYCPPEYHSGSRFLPPAAESKETSAQWMQ